MNHITDEALVRLRKLYSQGSRVRLVEMNYPYTQLLPGEMGTVDMVDSVGTIHVNWDCGSTLGVAFGADPCERIS